MARPLTPPAVSSTRILGPAANHQAACAQDAAADASARAEPGGISHYSDDIVRRFVHASKRNGIDVFRFFDALNDIRRRDIGSGRQGMRRPLRGCHQLHREPGAHARQLP